MVLFKVVWKTPTPKVMYLVMLRVENHSEFRVTIGNNRDKNETF